MVLSGVQTGYDTTRLATQVGLRPVKAGLGGHDAGASGLMRELKTHRSSNENGVDQHGWNCAPPVGYRHFQKQA